jgi:hypothetical protein
MSFYIGDNKRGKFPKALLDLEDPDLKDAYRMGHEHGVNSEKEVLGASKKSDEWKDWFTKGFKKGFKLGD